jgi:peroxiredoxin Q/BCP
MQPGDQVPPLKVRIQDGTVVPFDSLHEDGPLVLFFYPKAFTRGCTAESCHFRDLAAEFAALGAGIVGVSRDDAATQARFADEHDLGYPLVADTDGDVSRAFGTKRVGPLMSKRHTFVIDRDGTVLDVIKSESDMEQHADEALALLRARAEA